MWIQHEFVLNTIIANGNIFLHFLRMLSLIYINYETTIIRAIASVTSVCAS